MTPSLPATPPCGFHIPMPTLMAIVPVTMLGGRWNGLRDPPVALLCVWTRWERECYRRAVLRCQGFGEEESWLQPAIGRAGVCGVPVAVAHAKTSAGASAGWGRLEL